MHAVRQLIRCAFLASVGARCLAGIASGADPFPQTFVGPIEKAHHAEAWRAHPALACDLVVEFGGKRVFDGKMTMTTDAGRSRLVTHDGTLAVFDGRTAWVSPAPAPFPRARFHVLTWPYFLAVPYKLSDPGARLADLGDRPLAGATMPAARLTFAAETGDTPDDWYVIYRDPSTGRLTAMGYIVTYGTPLAEAEQEPHGIRYDRYETVEGVPVATDWSFWHWDLEQGLVEPQLGRVTLRNVRFVTPTADTFQAPASAREEKLPE